MVDNFSYEQEGLIAPATCAIDIAPSVSSIDVSRAVYIGGAGNLHVQMKDGGSTIFYGVTAGTVYPLRVEYILAASTTATSIIALY